MNELDCDVLVVGSGSAGSTAAIAAARTGARTILVERFGYLGGISTGGLDTFYAFYTPGERPRKVVAGIPDEIVAGLTAAGAAFERPNTYGAGTGITYDPEMLKRVWETTVAGATILLHAFAHEVELDGALMTRVRNVDATDPDALTRAEIEGRRQSWEYFRFLRDRVPGYESAVLVSTSPAIGVRESRRVHGDYRLTADDCLAARTFPDQIARCGAPIEDHHAGRDTRWVYVPGGGTYGIPYRALLPRGIEGLLVAGRCFSATHDAHASARSMGTCMAMGQAAGTAAGLAAAAGLTPRELPIERLLECLDADGADLGQEREAA